MLKSKNKYQNLSTDCERLLYLMESGCCVICIVDCGGNGCKVCEANFFDNMYCIDYVYDLYYYTRQELVEHLNKKGVQFFDIENI